MTRWHYRQSYGLAIHSSRVRVLAGHHCVMTLRKILLRLYSSLPNLYTGQGVIYLLGWESNRGPGTRNGSLYTPGS